MTTPKLLSILALSIVAATAVADDRSQYVLNQVLEGLPKTAIMADYRYTIATFADPAPDGSTPLFTLDGVLFSGGWGSTGLTLETPGLPAPDYPDATFFTSVMTATPVIPGLWTLTGGEIVFSDAAATPVFRITFDAATLNADVGFGASDLALQGVTFYDLVDGLTFDRERFAFSFANDTETETGWTWTAAFTSSAIPEPASFLLLALPLVWRRRR